MPTWLRVYGLSRFLTSCWPHLFISLTSHPLFACLLKSELNRATSTCPWGLYPFSLVTYFGSVMQLQEISCAQSLRLPTLTAFPMTVNEIPMCRGGAGGGQVKIQGVFLDISFSLAKFNAFDDSIVLAFRISLASNQPGLTSSPRSKLSSLVSQIIVTALLGRGLQGNSIHRICSSI